MDPRERVIVAFDFKTMDEVVDLTSKLDGELVYAKVGMELYYTLGSEVVTFLKKKGLRIFLDLKLHDIPNTVGGALETLEKLGVDMVNVHAAGGSAMLKRARDAFSGTLIAVTQLTSISKEMMNVEQNIAGTVGDQVLHMAELAKKSGLDGVVCSALEAKKLRGDLGDDFILVTPGVRLDQSKASDQARVATPKQAIKDGSSYLVVGREITKASDPLAIFKKIVGEIS